MTSLGMPICLGCAHYDRSYQGWGYRCAAFPEGIPDTIIFSQVDHREAVDGDRGIRFEPVDARGADYAAELFGITADELARKTEVA